MRRRPCQISVRSGSLAFAQAPGTACLLDEAEAGRPRLFLPHSADKRSPEGRAVEREAIGNVALLKPQHRPPERVVAQRLACEPLAAKWVEEFTKRASRAASRPSSRAACLLAVVERQAFRGMFARAARSEVAKSPVEGDV